MKKELFDRGWEFSEAADMMAMFFQQWAPVDLPHDAMIGKPRAADNPSAGGGGFYPGSVANYRKRFDVPEAWRGRSVQLEFEGVYMNAEIALNHQPLHIQPYGYSSFVVDITPYLAYGQENELSVVANNTAQPNSRWYAGTGIYRHVWLRSGGEVYIEPWGVFVTAPVAGPEVSVIQVQTELGALSGRVTGAVLRSTVVDAAGAAVARVETPLRSLTVGQTLLVKGARLWSVDAPNLYTLRSEVWAGGALLDSEETTFGIRAIAVDAERGFRLNGVPLKLKGGCIHHDHGPLGAASYDRAEARKVELLKAAGFNALRTAHNPPAPALLDACDRLGMLVIDETFDCWRRGKNPNDYHLYFEEWWARDTAAMVRRDRNHPSVIMWSIGNEILESLGAPEGPEWAQRQADAVRALDPTRFVTSAVPIDFTAAMEDLNISAGLGLSPVPEDPEKDRWALLTTPFTQPLDIVGYNYLPQRYAVDAERFPGRVIAGTETWPHMAYFFWQETARLPHVIGDFVWTALDYLGEAGIGAVNFEGRPTFGAPYPYHLADCGDLDICGWKRPQSYYRDLLWGVRSAPYIAVLDPQHFGKPLGINPWGWEPVVESWTWPGHEGQAAQVDVYAVDDEVELLVNGASLGRKPAGAAAENKATFEVAYQPGTIEAVGYTGGVETGRTALQTASAPAALRLTADRAALDAAYGDLAYVTIEVVDAQGVRVPHADPLVAVTVEGQDEAKRSSVGALIALGTPDPRSEESYAGPERHAYQGRLLAVVRTGGAAGAIAVTARAEGLPEAEVRLEAR